jgi:hypothetical protein
MSYYLRGFTIWAILVIRIVDCSHCLQPEFRNYVIKEKIEGTLVCEVLKLFKAMASSETEIKLSPIDLRSKFVKL